MKLIWILPVILAAQSVDITYSPQGSEVLKALTGKRIKGTQIVSVTACQKAPGLPLAFDSSRIFQDATAKGWEPRDPELVPSLITATVNRNWKKITLDVMRVALGVAATVTVGNIVTASDAIKTALVMAGPASEIAGAALRARLPDSGPLLSRLLNGPLAIPAGGCARGVMLAQYPGPKGAALISTLTLPETPVVLAGIRYEMVDGDWIVTSRPAMRR